MAHATARRRGGPSDAVVFSGRGASVDVVLLAVVVRLGLHLNRLVVAIHQVAKFVALVSLDVLQVLDEESLVRVVGESIVEPPVGTPALVQQLLDQVRQATGFELALPDGGAVAGQLIRLDGCVKCHEGSFKYMRGCQLCATQTVMQFKGADADLIISAVRSDTTQGRTGRDA